MAEPLCILQVHAHPDDESSKGAGTVTRYHDEGIRTVLVCCTGGEEGDILNPALDLPEVRERLHEVRMEELAVATKIIGYDEVVMLGYRDSGMPDTEANSRPEAFANAPIEESVGRLVEIIRRERPQVIVTYGDDQQGYPPGPPHGPRHHHPGVGRGRRSVCVPRAGRAVDAVEALLLGLVARARMLATHEAFAELGLESPFGEEWFKRPSQDDRITTQVSLVGYEDIRFEALLAHGTQVDPKSPFWFRAAS
jgi:mycothiol S-conjugate amidase